MDITKVDSNDYDRIVEVWEASVRATHHFLEESDIEFFRPKVREYLLKVELFAVRDDTGAVIGFGGVVDDSLEMLFIHPDQFGRGVGRALLEHAVERLGVERLDVNEQNPQAVGFYLHMGFEVIGRSEVDETGRPFPLLHMRRVTSGDD